MSIIITVDGPAASGKTSVSRLLARKLGYEWVSTGAFYRALAYVAYKKGISADDKNALLELAKSDEWQVKMSDEKTRVSYLNQDVTAEIQQEAVGEMASKTSQIPELRKELLEAQRKCAINAKHGLVAEGRDCGTVVFPNALVKIFLTADQELRAKRRADEHGTNVEGILASQKQRDLQDVSRSTAPLKVAEGAFNIDTTFLTLEQVVDYIEKIVREQISSVG